MALVRESVLPRRAPYGMYTVHRPMLYDAGLPDSVIRLNTWHAGEASTACPSGAGLEAPSRWSPCNCNGKGVLHADAVQLELPWRAPDSRQHVVRLTVAVDAINSRYGRTLIGYGQCGELGGYVGAKIAYGRILPLDDFH